MQTLFITKIIRVGSSYGVVIPAPILRQMDFDRGDHLVYGFSGPNQVTLRKLTDKEIRSIKPDIKFN